MESTICLHYQSGFCKFGEFCQKQHVHQVCSIQNCNIKSCRERHPKPCKHFNTVKSCKFGDLCAYKHEVSNEKKAVNDLTNQVKTLVDIVNSMSNNIARLEAEIKEIKSSDSTQISDFSCEKCNYKASSNTVLKRHTSTKHKHISLTPEKVRSSDSHDSPKLIIPSENRFEPDPDNMVTVPQSEPTENIYPPELPQSPITCADLRYGSVCHIQGTECIQTPHSFFMQVYLLYKEEPTLYSNIDTCTSCLRYISKNQMGNRLWVGKGLK